MNNEVDAADGKHSMIENWFYWCALVLVELTRNHHAGLDT